MQYKSRSETAWERTVVKRKLAFGLALSLMLAAAHRGPAMSQSAAKTTRSDIIGTWLLASHYAERQDGTRVLSFGADPKGIFMIGADGHFSYQIMGADRQKYAANSRTNGTPEEMRSVIQGSQVLYGTYTFDEPTHTITWNIERCLFPNWDGTQRKVSLVVDGDELRQEAEPIASPEGTLVPRIVWKRAKPAS